MVVSEKSGFNGSFKNYLVLENKDIGIAELYDNKITLKTNHKYSPKIMDTENFDLTSEPFPHWTLKEIYEQETSSSRALNFGGRILNESMVKLGGLEEHEKQLKDIKNLILLGCGTSLNACNFVKNYFLELTNLNSIQSYDGAEFEEIFIPKTGKTAFILVSQSGETKDLHRCIEIGKKNNCLLIGVVNVVDSMIAREVDCGVYTNAGREVGVASTKAFTNQVIVLILISIYFSQIHQINENKRIRFICNLRKLPSQIKETILISEEKKELYLNILLKAQSLFILGKGNAKFIGDEGSLKIKEISYIHSESYSGSALKHGPFALLDENLPVILLLSQNRYLDKMLNTYHEVKSRNSPIIIVSDLDLKLPNNIIVPYNEIFGELLAIYPLQLMAYYLSINKGLNCDKPRNLAKCVNVE
jgi:glucosamine--fructose-6-phosphate aminotransferase (isomerizing)